MLNLSAGISPDFKVAVQTTKNRGFTPEELAGMCADKIVHVADDAPPAIRDQARAFKAQVEQVVVQYMKQALHSDRTTLYNMLETQGHKDMADLIRRL